MRLHIFIHKVTLCLCLCGSNITSANKDEVDPQTHIELIAGDTLDLETADGAQFVRLSGFPKLVPFPFQVSCSQIKTSPDRRWIVLLLNRNRDTISRDYFGLLVSHKMLATEQWSVYYNMFEADLNLQHGARSFISSLTALDDNGGLSLKIGRASTPKGRATIVYSEETWSMLKDSK